MLTIIMPLFNQERYIAKALDSIIMQKTSYPYKIIIADDFSSDDSLNIAESYCKKYPNIINILPSTSNNKLYKNILRVYRKLDTKYFCVLDPDDFYTNPTLIQNALDFLESNDDFSMYFENTLVQYDDGNQVIYLSGKNSATFDFRDYLNGKVALGHTSCTFFRNLIFGRNFKDTIDNFPTKTFEQSFRGDSFRNLIHISYGKAHFEPRLSSVYRVHSNGIWQSLGVSEQSLINACFYRDMWLFYDKQHIELLAFGHRNYQNIFSDDFFYNIFYALMHPKESSKILGLIDNMKDLLSVFIENKDKLDNYKGRVNIKYKFLLYLHNKISKKLTKKGLLYTTDVKSIFDSVLINNGGG